jgi:hypothetical protein
MKSLDELLIEKAQKDYQLKLVEILAPETWTEANRDQKLKEIRELSIEVSDLTEKFVKDLLETEASGKSLLWHKILEQFISGEIQLLAGFREQLDSNQRGVLSSFPVTYQWVAENIQKRYDEIRASSTLLDKTFDGDVEEI